MRALVIGDSITVGIRRQLEAAGHIVVAMTGWSVNAFLRQQFVYGQPTTLEQLVEYLYGTGDIDLVLVALGTNPGDPIGLQAFQEQVRTLWATVTNFGWPGRWIGPWGGPQAQDRLDVIRSVVGHRAIDGRALASGLRRASDGLHFLDSENDELALRVLGVLPSIRPWWFPFYVGGALAAGILLVAGAVAVYRASGPYRMFPQRTGARRSKWADR
jgi:hypothetical protein